MLLSAMRAGQKGTITALLPQLDNQNKRKLLSLGFTPNTRIQFVRFSPFSKSMQLIVRDTSICLQPELCRAIEVTINEK